MGYLTGGVGAAQAYLEADCQRLRQRFQPSRSFLDRMEQLYDRRKAVSGHALQGMRPTERFNATDRARMARTLYRSNDVHQMVVSFLNRMERSPVVVNVAVTAGTAAEGARQSVLEQFCQGILDQQTRTTVEEHRGTTWIRRMSGFAARRASIAQRVDVSVKENGQAVIRWELYDPYNCYFDYGAKPRRFFYDRYDRKVVVWQELSAMGLRLPMLEKEKKDDEYVCVTDHWLEDEDGVWNTVLVDGVVAREPYRMPNGRIPISVVCLNNGDLEPNTWGTGALGAAAPENYLEMLREPFYASLEHTIPQFEDLLSLELLGAAFQVNPPLKVRNLTGEQQGLAEFQVDLWGPGATVIMPSGWDIEMMNLSSAASLEKFASYGELKGQIDRVFPVILFGATSGANESGFLYNQRIDQGQNAIVNPALGVALAIQLGLEEVLYQFRKSGEGYLDLAVKEDPDSQMRQVKRFRVDDLPRDGYELAVTVPPQLASDDLRQVQIFQTVLTSGMMDEKLALSLVGKVQDPEAVIRRKMEDKLRNSDEAMREAKLRVMFEEAEFLAEQADREQDRAKRNRLRLAAMRAQQHAEAWERTLINAGPAFQMEPNPMGIAPAQQPPEERGIENPSVQRALAGTPPPGGRPQAQAVPGVVGAGVGAGAEGGF